jgi:hypothetical protein
MLDGRQVSALRTDEYFAGRAKRTGEHWVALVVALA